MKTRKLWIDLLRGIAMLLVIWGHIDRTHRLFFVSTSPFKIPMFFAITGYVFNDKNGNTKEFFRNLFTRTIIPWLILSVIWINIPVAFMKGGINEAYTVMYNFVSGKTSWFIPCYIVTEILFFLVRKYVKSTPAQYCALVLLTLLGIVFGRLGIMRFALVDVACTSMGFVLFGYWFKNNEEKIRSLFSGAKMYIPLGVYLFFIVLNLTVFERKTMDVHTNKYFNYPVNGAMVFTSILFLFLIAGYYNEYLSAEKNLSDHKISVKNIFSWITFVGQNTLVFYITHSTLRKIGRAFLSLFGITLPKNTPAFIMTMIILCFSLTVESMFINKYLPFAVGKRKTG